MLLLGKVEIITIFIYVTVQCQVGSLSLLYFVINSMFTSTDMFQSAYAIGKRALFSCIVRWMLARSFNLYLEMDDSHLKLHHLTNIPDLTAEDKFTNFPDFRDE